MLWKPQNAFTEALELARYKQLDLEFKALLRVSLERRVWLKLDWISTQWVAALQSPVLGSVLGNDVVP